MVMRKLFCVYQLVAATESWNAILRSRAAGLSDLLTGVWIEAAKVGNVNNHNYDIPSLGECMLSP
jgi:hypothetical protein